MFFYFCTYWVLLAINKDFSQNQQFYIFVGAISLVPSLRSFFKVRKFLSTSRNFSVCVKRITFCNCLCSSSPSSSRDFASVIRNIEKFEAKIYFTDHRTAKTIAVLEIQFRSLKYMTAIRIRKNLRHIPFL